MTGILADDIESDLIENVICKDSELLEELLYEFAKTWDDLKFQTIYHQIKNSG
tara:strand:+ start:1841 stop:1999 length:159 start_codon:yes stop_codon:yes gene_type:complete